MTTIQGIINKGVVNAELQFEKMGYISSNIANYNTSGYKAVRFEQMLSENGYLSGVERRDYSQGDIQRTDREFDVAIEGVGFIPVTPHNADGWRIEPPVSVPVAAAQIFADTAAAEPPEEPPATRSTSELFAL